MTWFLFAGDMAVMFGMTALAIWLFTRTDGRDAARIPLDDEAEATTTEPTEKGEGESV